MGKKIIYIISGRNATSTNPGRKITEIIKTWSKDNTVVPVFGGDLFLGVGYNNNNKFGDPNIHKHTYRQSFLWISLSEIKDIIHNYITLLKLFHINKKQNIDIIWERSTRLHWAGLIASKIFNKIYVLEWKDHLIPKEESLLKWLGKYIEKRKVTKSDYIVIESKVLKNAIIKEYDIPENKVIVALNAVNFLDFNANSSKSYLSNLIPKLKSKKIIVSYLGSFAFYHDSERLVKAAKIIRKTHPEIGVVMVGDGKDREYCVKLATELGIINDNLFFLSSVKKSEVPAILNDTNIAVLPGSTDIICPIKIMEYMAAGCATIAPDYECNREVLINNKTGLLFEPHNEKSLAEAIINLAMDNNLRSTISHNGRNYSQKILSWESTWGAALNIIKKHLDS